MRNLLKKWFFGLESSQQTEMNLLSLKLSILVYENHTGSFWKWISPLGLVVIFPQVSSDWRCNKLQVLSFLISQNLAVEVKINGCYFFTNRFVKFYVLYKNVLYKNFQSYTARIVNKKLKNRPQHIELE